MPRAAVLSFRWVLAGLIACLSLASRGGALEYVGNLEFRGNPFPLSGSSKAAGTSTGVSGTSGAAAVNIPIALPPGPGGLAPSLSLDYSSDRGDGPFGLGWNLPLGEVRCTARFGVPDYASCSVFELDGQLLVGPDTRPGLQGRYHTRVESFQRIVREGSGAGAYWEATLPGGTRHLYGETLDSKIGSDGRNTPASAPTARWLLSKIVDIHGNEIRITYDRSDVGVAYPLEISYASGARKVTFLYEGRPDEILDFAGGIPRHLTKRLREIVITSLGEVVSRRLIRYSEPGEHATQRSRISSTQLFGKGCREPGPDCAALPVERFDYTDALADSDEPYWAMAASEAWQAGIFVKTGAETTSDDLGRRLADVDGDGRPDLVVSYCSDAAVRCPEAEGPVVYLNDGAGWVKDAAWTAALAGLRYEAPTITVHSAPYGTYYRRICDANFGTVTRRISFAAGEPDWIPIAVEGIDTETYTPWPSWHLIDVNGDGLADLVTSIATAAARAYDCEGVHVSGELSDLFQLVEGPGAKQIFLNNGSGWEPAPAGMAESLPIFQMQIIVKHVSDYENFVTRSSDCDGIGLLGGWSGSSYCSIWKDFRPQFVELNGDGLADLVALYSGPDDQALWIDYFDGAEWIDAPSSAAWIQSPDGSGWTIAPDFGLPFPHIKYNLIKAPSYSRFGVGGMQTYDFGVYFVDLNRDGLTDVVKDAWYSNPALVLINTGTGWCNDLGAVAPIDCDPDPTHSRYLPPIPFNEYSVDPFREVPISESTQLVFADLNGDGWIDLMQGKDGVDGDPDGLRAWLHDPSAAALDPSGKPSVWIERSGAFAPPEPFHPGTQFVDLDGNGTSDILHGWRLYGYGEEWIADAAYLSPGASSDLLVSVDNGRGGFTQFAYQNAAFQRDETLEQAAEAHAASLGDAAGGSAIVTLFIPKPVVSAQTIGGVGIPAEVTTRYRYARPRFDPLDRRLAGFGLVETTRPDGSKIDAYFDQRSGLEGRPSKQEIFDERGGLVRESVETWGVAARPGEIRGAMEGVSVARELSQASFNVYAGESGPTHVRRFSYDDAYGYNFISQIAEVRETGSLTTLFTPAAPVDSASWLVGLIEEMQQVSAGITYAREVYRYTARGQVASRSRYIGIRGGYRTSDVSTVSWTYDVHGNVISETQTRGRAAAGDVLDPLVFEFCYDGDSSGDSWCPRLPDGVPATHSLRVASKDPLGAVVEAEPDWSTGAVRQVQRFTEWGTFRNSLRVVRDGFGRVTQSWFRGAGFDDNQPDVQLAETRFHDAPQESTPAYVEDLRFTKPEGGAAIRTARYLDGFGNPFRTVGETPSGYRATAQFRNPITRITRSVGPIACERLDDSCGGIAENLEPFSEQELDALGRVVRTRSPDGQVTTAYARIERSSPVGDGSEGVFDSVATLNANGQMTRRLMDGSRVVWVDECFDAGCYNEPASTFYQYEPTGEISTIYDAIAASTRDYASRARQLRYRYDTLGRMVQTDEPNSGSSFAAYDHQGHVTRAKNARGMTTLREYDPLGRVVSIDRPAGVGEWDLEFRYDPISRKRSRVTSPDSGYSDLWEYDDFGHLTRQTRTFIDTLAMSFEYDLLGRPIRIDYPSNHASASYVYEGAYLKQVCRGEETCVDTSANLVISDVQYDALGRRVDVATSEGILHREYYAAADDPSGRSVNGLKRLAITAGPAAGALDFDYAYDPEGNITSIADHSTTYDASATYTYDARNRLRSWTDAEGATRWYTYDPLGNLVGHGVASAGGINQDFDPAARPHQIRRNRIGDDYAYDGDGNVSRRGSTFFVYNSANQLVCTGSSEGTCDGPGYRYDVDGRLLWDGAAGQLLIGDLFRWQPQGLVAYSSIFAFGEKLAELEQEHIRLRTGGALLVRRLAVPWRRILWMSASAAALALLALAATSGIGSAIRAAPASATVALALAGLLVAPPPVWAMGGRRRGTVTTLRVYFRDHLGSAAYVAGPDVRQAYEPFGKPILAAAGALDEFSEKPYHTAIELYSFGARWYDADSGRFAGADPLVAGPINPQELNAYSYAANDPVNRVDPTGMFTTCTPSGRVCFGDGGRFYYSNVPGGFQPFAPKWTTPAAGPISAGVASTASNWGSIRRWVVYDDDGYPWTYRNFKSEKQPLSSGVGSAPEGARSGFWGAIGHAIRKLGAILSNDLASTLTGLVGNVYGIAKGLVTSLVGLVMFDSAALRSGLSGFGWSLVPRYGFFSGPGWGRPTNLGYPPFDNPIDRGARIHDEIHTQPGADRRLIRDVWSGNDLGPYGQVYRVLLTTVFGVRVGLGLDD